MLLSYGRNVKALMQESIVELIDPNTPLKVEHENPANRWLKTKIIALEKWISRLLGHKESEVNAGSTPAAQEHAAAMMSADPRRERTSEPKVLGPYTAQQAQRKAAMTPQQLS